MRKIIGSTAMLAWIVVYVVIAAAFGDRLRDASFLIKLVYFPVAGLAWVLPLKPLLRWMHVKDAPVESPDV